MKHQDMTNYYTVVYVPADTTCKNNNVIICHSLKCVFKPQTKIKFTLLYFTSVIVLMILLITWKHNAESL